MARLLHVWMFIHPTEYGDDIGLERLSYQSKIISINIRISPLLSREKVKHARKFIGSFEAAAFYFTTELVFPA